MKRYIFPLALLCALLVVGAAYILRAPAPSGTPTGTQEQATTTSAVVAPVPTTVPTANGPKTYTSADVALHASSSSCWTSISGKVYDLTSWIAQHPGGPEPILSLCGTDGTAAFTAQHGGQRRPEAELATFFIGNVSSP